MKIWKAASKWLVHKEPVDVYGALKILCRNKKKKRKKEILRWNPDEDKKNRRNQIKYFDRKTKLQTKGCGNDRGRNPNTEIGDLK